MASSAERWAGDRVQLTQARADGGRGCAVQEKMVVGAHDEINVCNGGSDLHVRGCEGTYGGQGGQGAGVVEEDGGGVEGCPRFRGSLMMWRVGSPACSWSGCQFHWAMI